jgi:hypothetical protein
MCGTDARRPVSWVSALLADELANAPLDRRDHHRRTGLVMLPVSTRHADDLARAVQAPPGNPGPASDACWPCGGAAAGASVLASRRSGLGLAAVDGDGPGEGVEDHAEPEGCPTEVSPGAQSARRSTVRNGTARVRSDGAWSTLSGRDRIAPRLRVGGPRNAPSSAARWEPGPLAVTAAPAVIS